MLVKDLEDKDLQFISDSQETEVIKSRLGRKAKEFDSFFVRVEDGEYAEVYGMRGAVPYLNRQVVQLVPSITPQRKRYYKVRIFREFSRTKAREYSAREAKDRALEIAYQRFYLGSDEPIKVVTEEITKEEYYRDFEN